MHEIILYNCKKGLQFYRLLLFVHIFHKFDKNVQKVGVNRPSLIYYKLYSPWTCKYLKRKLLIYAHYGPLNNGRSSERVSGVVYPQKVSNQILLILCKIWEKWVNYTINPFSLLYRWNPFPFYRLLDPTSRFKANTQSLRTYMSIYVYIDRTR